MLASTVVAGASRATSSWQLHDALGWVGLAKRRSRILDTFGYIGLGAVFGAGAALLFAPASGQGTRQRLALQFARAKAATVKLARHTNEPQPERDEVSNGKSTQNGHQPSEDHAHVG
ncbi:MAG TPA: YtxH domain-containing protein [Polyangiaceae bacterium]|jgi:hypothetical protein|nr:YtxH domain-containing protein [Polyangiaceae bacterium]